LGEREGEERAEKASRARVRADMGEERDLGGGYALSITPLYSQIELAHGKKI